MPQASEYTTALAKALDDYWTGTVSSGTGSTVVSSGLISGFASASTSPRTGKYVLHISPSIAPQQRVVRTTSVSVPTYVASSGTLTVDPTWTAPVAADNIETTSYFPMLPCPLEAVTDYRTLVNNALQRIEYPTRLTVAITTSGRLSLAAYAEWFKRSDQFLYTEPSVDPKTGRYVEGQGFYEPGPTGDIAVFAGWRRPRLVFEGGTPYLELDVPFSRATGNLQISVLRRADTLIAVGGTTGESTVGLVNRTDQAFVPVQTVVDVALEEAYEVLAARTPGVPNGDWTKRLATQRGIAQRAIDQMAGRPASSAQPQGVAA